MKFFRPHTPAICFLVLLFNIFISCKRDAKVSIGKLNEGFYQLEILERYEYPPDSSDYQKKSLKDAQFYHQTPFFITKSLKSNHYTACVTENGVFYEGCDLFNCKIDVIYVNDDSVYFQNPPCRIVGNKDDFVPKEPFGPEFFVDSSIQYQVKFSGLQLSKKLDLTGTWKELVACKYISKINGIDQIDSVVNKNLYVKFRLKFVKSI
ncbi:MAG: hypothetical protein ACOVP1_05810 [Bacteroidia bacterium]